MIKESSIYIGNVIHKRFKPKIHFFKYKVFSILLDLSEINLLNKSLKIIRIKRQLKLQILNTLVLTLQVSL